MKQLQKDLKAVTRDLKKLTQKTERMANKLSRLERTQSPKKPKARAKSAKKAVAKKAKRGSASDRVLSIIKRSRKGIDTATLKNKTRFNDKKIYNALHRLKQYGKIKSAGYGFYIKA